MRKFIIFITVMLTFFLVSCGSSGKTVTNDSDLDNLTEQESNFDLDKGFKDSDIQNSDSSDKDNIEQDSTGDIDNATDINETDVNPDSVDEIPDVDSDSDTSPDFPVEECEVLTPISGKVCSITKGASGNDAILLKGNVLGTDKIYTGGQVLISFDGTIKCVGCKCDEDLEAKDATVVTCPNGVISPALINAHDHMGWTQNAPKKWGTERYEHRNDWRIGKNGHTKITATGKATTDNKIWGELRNVMAGTVTIAGSGGASGLLRNVDKTTWLEGLHKGDVDYQTFPLGDIDGTQLTNSCAYPRKPSLSVLNDGCYLPHVAEGINLVARNEFLCLSSTKNGGVDVTEPNSTFIHTIGLIAKDGEELASNDTAIIWSPRSNISLYGNTAQVTMYHNQGVLIGMGTDWTPSGSIQMLRELKCAINLNEKYYNHFFSDRDLWLMATQNNALALHIAEVTGAIKKGLMADIAIFDGKDATNLYRAVIDSNVKKVALVMRAGMVLYGDKNIVTNLPFGADCEDFDVCGETKSVCLKREEGMTLSELKSKNTSSYGLFFCGTPTDEPTCTPMRTANNDVHPYTGEITDYDKDGDGIENSADNCPNIFNPIRPLDNGKQADEDGDGIGDECDPCPLKAGTTNCKHSNPNDFDDDGIANFKDNCPYKSNPDQKDSDKDGTGDACDACPNLSNPGFSACPSTIYDIKQNKIPVASNVKISGIVTAKKDNSFYMQMSDKVTGWDSTLKEKFGGIFVLVSTVGSLSIPKLGDIVELEGTTKDYYGQLEIVNPTKITIKSSETVPNPIIVNPLDIKTGGKYEKAYNCILVKIENVKVLANDLGYNEFSVTDDFRVDDYLYSYTMPNVGTTFSSLTGILGYSFSNSKLFPRNIDDMKSDLCAGVSCDESWSECNENTGKCEAKTGFCATTSECNGSTPVCNKTTHKCEAGDPCKDVVCSNDWEECKESSGECEVKSGRCNTSKDCQTMETCNTTNHNCEATTNLILNSSFEEWTNDTPENWHGSKSSIAISNVVKYTTATHSGTNACQLINTSSSHKRFTTKEFTLKAGTYSCFYFARGHGEIRNAYYFDGSYSSYSNYTIIDSDDWTKVEYSFTLSTEKPDFQLIFSIRNTNADKEHLQIDDVFCEKN